MKTPKNLNSSLSASLEKKQVLIHWGRSLHIRHFVPKFVTVNILKVYIDSVKAISVPLLPAERAVSSTSRNK